MQEALGAGSKEYYDQQREAIRKQIENQGGSALAKLSNALAARGLGTSGATLQGMAETSGATQSALGQALANLAGKEAQTDIARLGELGRIQHGLGSQALQQKGLQYGTQMQAAGLESDLQNQNFQQQLQDYYALLQSIQLALNAGANKGKFTPISYIAANL